MHLFHACLVQPGEVLLKKLLYVTEKDSNGSYKNKFKKIL